MYTLVATGGTFDRFHKGHEALLTKAFEVSDKVIIGITSDEMVKRENLPAGEAGRILKDHILPYSKRVEDVKKFLREKRWHGREIIAQLNDIYGPTVLENPIEAIVCTRETRFGATAINKARKDKRLPKADIIECTFIVSEDKKHISSTRIRLGEIDRSGNIFKSTVDRKLPEEFRNQLHKPVSDFYTTLTPIFNKYKNPTLIICVGDYLYQSMLTIGINPGIAFIDNEVDKYDYLVRNPAGGVTKELFTTLKKALKDYLTNKKNIIIYVEGEEDLAVLPAILLSPLDSLILYGQPRIMRGQKSGVVAVTVTEEKKKWAFQLFNQFNI